MGRHDAVDAGRSGPMLTHRPQRHSRKEAIVAAACAAGLGVVLLVAWFVQSVSAGLNDTSNYRPEPSPVLLWVAEILIVGGIGAVVALDIFRRSRRRPWCALGV